MTQSFDDELVHKTVLELFNMVKSKQAEVDSINRDLNHAFATVEIQEAEIDKLQKRIDGAISILTGMRHNGAYRALDILKGESNEH